MKKIYQQVEVEISTLQMQDVLAASTQTGSGDAGDLDWLSINGGGTI